jgi:cbb3-type cytochrome oxidase subunit 1
MLARRFFRHSVIYILIGISIGIYMAASHNHTLAPAHAHLNLLGYVSMALYGLFYRAWPAAADDRFANWHFWIANIGVVGLIASLIPLLLGYGAAEPFTAAFSFVVLAGMILFAIVVFRATAKDV